MATKPTERIPDWASGGTVADPGSSKEAAGWTVSERMPAGWINWIWNTVGKWLSYLEEVTDEHASEKAEYSVTGTGSADKVAIRNFTSSGGELTTLYANDSFEGVFTLAHGCVWSQGTGWIASGGGTPGLVSLDATTPDISISGGTLSGGSFAQTTRLVPPIVLCRVETGATPSVVQDSLNTVASVANNGSSIDVTLDIDVASVNSSHVFVNSSQFRYPCQGAWQATNLIRIAAGDIQDSGNLENLSTTTLQFDVIAYGTVV